MASLIRAVGMPLTESVIALIESCDIMDMSYKMEWIFVSTKAKHYASVKLASLMKEEKVRKKEDEAIMPAQLPE